MLKHFERNDNVKKGARERKYRPVKEHIDSARGVIMTAHLNVNTSIRRYVLEEPKIGFRAAPDSRGRARP